MGKAVARKSHQSLAKECLKSPETRKYVLIQLGTILRRELKTMCSDSVGSILQLKFTSDNEPFCWELLLKELTVYAPTVFDILKQCTHTHHQRENRTSIIGTCAAILLKYRYMNMSALQKTISVILYAGHASKLVCYT